VTKFSYLVIDSTGRRRAGCNESSSEATLLSVLEGRGEFVVNVSIADDNDLLSTRTRGSASKRLLEVTRSLAALIPAGLPLSEAIQTAAEMTDSASRAVLEQLRTRVEQGESLSSAMSASGSFFPRHYTSLIAAGERSGKLAISITKLAAQLEHEDRLRSRLVAAAIYPILLSTASACSAILLVGFVLPRFAVLFETTGARLPALAALSIRAAVVARGALPLLALGAIAFVAAIMIQTRTKRGALRQSAFLHRVPFLGSLIRERIASRFARLTGLLLDGGVPLSQAMDAAVESIDDPLSRKIIEDARSDVLSGGALSGALAARRFFPDLMIRLVLLGESSGRLPEFLLQAAEYYEDRLQDQARRLIAIAEPVVILLFGGVVGTIALALLQTVYGVNAGTLR